VVASIDYPISKPQNARTRIAVDVQTTTHVACRQKLIQRPGHVCLTPWADLR
jgi:hypothetical protein